MINLSCPKCTTELEIDDGFAGGICRCFECGTLMTVPAQSQGQAEMLTRARPDRPDRPDSPAADSAAESPSAEASAPPERPEAPQAPEPTTGPEADAADSGGKATTLVTASGREVKVSEDQLKRVAVARRRRVGVRIGTLLVILVIIGGLAAAAVLLGLNLLRSVEQAEQSQTQPDDRPDTDPVKMEDVLAYDPYANPYLTETPNVFGLPLDPDRDRPVALIVDTSFYMQDQLTFVRTVLPVNLRTLAADVAIQLWLTRAEEARAFPEAPAPPAEWDIASLKELLKSVEARGEQAMLPAIEQAVEQGAEHLVMVCHFKPGDEQLEAIRKRIEEGGLAIDVVQLGRSSSGLRELAEIFNGRYATIPKRRLDDWRRAYREQAEREAGGGQPDGGATSPATDG